MAKISQCQHKLLNIYAQYISTFSSSTILARYSLPSELMIFHFIITLFLAYFSNTVNYILFHFIEKSNNNYYFYC